MALLPLDVPLALKAISEECSVDPVACTHIDMLGFKTIALVGHALPGLDQLDLFAEKLAPTDLGATFDPFPVPGCKLAQNDSQML